MLSEVGNLRAIGDGRTTNVVEDVRFELDRLEGFKKPFIDNADLNWSEYNGTSEDECGQKTDTYAVNLLYSMVQTAMAGLGSSLPGMKFIGIDEYGQNASKIMFQVISEWLLRDETQSKILTTIQDSFISGAGYTYIGFSDSTREVNITKWKNGKSRIVKDKITDYYGPRTYWIPFKNVYHNGYKLADATKVFIKRIMTEDEFHAAYNPKFNSLYDYNIDDVMLESVKTDVDTEEEKYQRFDNVNIVECFDLIHNTWTVTANDSWINKYKGQLAPNPYPHRQAPLSEFVPYPNAHHQYGDNIGQKTEQQRFEYNEINKTIIQSADLMKGFMGGEAFEDDNLRPQKDEETGLYIMNGYTKESVWHFSPNINLSYHMQHKRDIISDLILVSGIDFTNTTVANPYETSTSVNSRKQSFDKRINMVIKENYLPYFGRIVYQMIENLQHMYDFKKEKMLIPFKDRTVTKSEAGHISIESTIGNTSTVDITFEDLKGKVDFFLDGDMLIGPNKQAQFEEMEHMIGMLTAFVDPDSGKPIVDPKQAVGLMQRMYNYWDITDVITNDKDAQEVSDSIFGNTQAQGTPPAQTINAGIPTQGSRSNIPPEQQV